MNRAVSSIIAVFAIIAFVSPLTWGEDKPMSPVDSLLQQASGMSRRGGKVIVPCDFELHLRPYPSQAGPVDIHVKLTPQFDCENGVELTIDTLDNLTNLGGSHYAIPGVLGEISNIDIQVEIPPLDTSSLTLRLSGVGKAWEYKIPMSFVSESDTIRFYYGSDRFSLRPRVIERPKRVMSARDSIAHLGAEFQPPPTVRIGQYDENDTIRTVDDFIRSMRPNAPMEWHSPIDVSITTEPSTLTAGPMTLNLKAKLNVPCDGVRVELARDDNVKYQGQRKWTYELEAGDSIMLALPIGIPSEDTCGIQLRLFCGELRQWATVYFVSTAQSVKRFDHDIRYSGHGANHKGKRKSIGIPDSVKAGKDSAK